MKRIILISALALSAAALLSCSPKDNKTYLFNGNDLSGWTLSVDPSAGVPAEEVFGVKDGVITISGQPFGYMMTEEVFGDYKLHVEWRWVDGPSNSGLFQRCEPAEGLWPRCAEVNLKANAAGGMVAMNGFTIKELEGTGKIVIQPEDPENVPEFEPGEWNTAEVICKGDFIQAYINGVFKNEAHLDRTEGRIAFQSEGGPLEIRNAYITPLE